MAFHCLLVTPEQQPLDTEVVQAVVPAYDGLLGILTGRAPLLVKLAPGPLRLDLADGTARHFFVDGGFAQVRDNRLTVLTTDAIPADRIDLQAARTEYEQALARRATSDEDIAERQRLLDRARGKQHAATSRTT